jgi:ParB family transcriptional regulator, chromosome partitioning protein
MSNAFANQRTAEIVSMQERRLDRTILRTYRTKVDIDTVVPNEKQPRLGPKIDEELQRQIEANGGLFEPILVEPHPILTGKFRIIDGDRRWTNSRILVDQGKDEFRLVPVEVTDKTLSDEDRFRVWVYIHRQRKEWDAKEKEMVAYSLVELMGRASAANVLGITVRELDKLVEIFELSEKFTSLRDPSAAITWARELMGVNKKLLTPSVSEAVIEKVNQKRITNSKDLRKLRQILSDPVSRSHFLKPEGDLESSLIRLREPTKAPKSGLFNKLDAAFDTMKNVPWTELQELKHDPKIIQKIDDVEALLRSLRNALS